MTRKFRKGDSITFDGTVMYDQSEGDGDLWVRFGEDSPNHILPAMHAKLVMPAVAVGEYVRWMGKQTGRVLAVDEDALWVKRADDGGYGIWKRKDVEVLVGGPGESASPVIVED